MHFFLWRTLMLGTGLNTPDDFVKALNKRNCICGAGAERMLRSGEFMRSISRGPTEVELVRVDLLELGFKGGTTRTELYARSRKLRLGFCPAELGPQLCLHGCSLEKGERVMIASRAMEAETSNPHLFLIRREKDGDQIYLHAEGSDAETMYLTSTKWIFLRR